MTPEKCFYVPGARHIQDGAILKAGEYVGQYSGETLAEMATRVPGVTLCDFESACDQAKIVREADLCRGPLEITKEQYWEMLEVLPPCKWERHRGAECFYVSEAIDADIHAWHVKIGERYWALNRSRSRTPESIIDEVAAVR